MVMKMNKKDFINKLKEQLNYSEEMCIEIDNILESNFIFSNKNKIKVINQLEEKLNIKKDKAEEIYNVSLEIISFELKRKIRHPFNLR